MGDAPIDRSSGPSVLIDGGPPSVPTSDASLPGPVGPDGKGPPPTATDPPPDPDLPPLAPPEARYHTYEEVEDFVQTLELRHPSRVRVDTYGTSSSGRTLYVVTISDDVAVPETDEPKALINFSIHGDEIITVECALAFLYTLTERYHDDPRIAAVVDTYELRVVPVVSPDSFDRRTREVEGVDPNREFPWDGNPSRNSIGVIAAARTLFESDRYAGTLDFHAFGELILLPFGGSFQRPSDWAQLANVADRLADVAGYRPIQISEMFGEIALGGSVDYYHWRGGGISMAVELTTDKAPPEYAITDIADDATEMALRFVEAL
jgi:hypothetical protein